MDKEVIVAFAEMDENLSWYLDDNIKQFVLEPASVKKPMGPSFTDPFGGTNIRETMNGFIYGGTWLFHCHVEPHLTAGMQGRFVVSPAAVKVAAKPTR